jgi:YidC/Oxa1 family membrane protein insertase
LSAIANFIGQCLEYLYQFTDMLGIPSYALAIVLLTVAIKLILFPLNLKQNKSMKEMQRIQPLVMELNKKWANNPQKKNEEMLKLYQEHKINPMAGCLPLLIQFPILIGLFRGLMNFVPTNMEAYSFLWIPNLGQPDPTGWALPVITAAATFVQSYLSITDTSQGSQKIMLIAMPLLMGFWARSFPAGVCIYWFVFAVFGTLERIVVNGGHLKPEPIELPQKGKKGKKGVQDDDKSNH